MPAAANVIERDVVVVGGGFGGCYLLHLLREKGFSTVVLEASNRLGGVWAWSCYPGARVDCELPYYGFSDPAIWSTWKWTERFPAWQELRTYFDHVDSVWKLSQDVVYNNAVTEAVWHEDQNVWTLKTSDGQQYRCRWFIAATGTSYKKNFSDIKGMENFKGALHHSAAWPDTGVDLNGKRVAVIGAGSTGIQVVQESAKVASQVTQYMRTPNFAVPMRQRAISEEEIYHYKAHIGHVFAACRKTPTGLPIVGSRVSYFDETPEQRQARWEEGWKRGGFNWSRGGYMDTGLNKEVNKAAYQFWRDKTRQRIKDPQKAELLAPTEAPYFIGTKRPSLEQDYYEMADLPTTEITNSPISEITETGIRTQDGKTREFDVIAVCTGYDAVTGGLRTMGIKGRDGIDLDQKWEQGVVTNVGMSVNGFPNFFMVYGPQAPTSLTNGPPFIELQCEWILDLLLKQRGENIQTVEASKSAEEAWRKHTLDIADKTLAVQTNSWYMGANVPGKRREMLVYMGGIPMWHDACVKALEGWKDFDTTREPEGRNVSVLAKLA